MKQTDLRPLTCTSTRTCTVEPTSLMRHQFIPFLDVAVCNINPHSSTCISSGLCFVCPETPSTHVFKYMTSDTINHHLSKLIYDSCAEPSTQQSHTILVRPGTPSTHILKYMTSDTIEHHLGKLLYDSCAEPSIQQSHITHNSKKYNCSKPSQA